MTTDAARVLRIPDTSNFKFDPPRPVRILASHSPGTAYDFAAIFTFAGIGFGATGVNVPPGPIFTASQHPIREKSFDPSSRPPVKAPNPSVAPEFQDLPVENMGEGIEGLPPQPFPPIKAECGWLRHVHDTGGADQSEPLWKLANNCCVFLQDGEKLIHALSNKYPNYTFKETETKFDRARKDQKTKDLGWPQCQTIHDHGSEHCKTCPHLVAGGSPLHLALRAQEVDEIDEQITAGPKIAPDRQPASPRKILPSPANPMKVARLFVDQHCRHDNVLTLHHWRGAWWRWWHSHWREFEDSAVRSLLYKFTENASYREAKGNAVPWAPNRKKIGDVLDALKAITILDNDIDQPTWLDGRSSDVIVAVTNGLLELQSRQLLPHSPLFFNHTAVPFAYDENAPQPTRWLDFLNAVWPTPIQKPAIDVLGEWFGYVISGRTDLQKIFMMVGPTRGGKGVIARIETALIGKKNVAGPTLSSFGTEFGMESLIGKSLGIISDARSTSGGKNPSVGDVAVERLLSISGEDTITVARKNKTAWIGKLSVRLDLLSNPLLRLGDASGAIIGRLVLLLTTESWLGREDFNLEKNLQPELTGILNWALDGLCRLTITNENHSTRFEPAEEAITLMRDLASPVGAFVREMCELNNNAETPVDELYAAYKNWCETSEYRKSPKSHFGRDLRAACPSVYKTRPRDKSSHRSNVYTGIKLINDEEPPFE